MKKLLFLSLLFLTACSMAVQKPTVALKDVRFAGLNGDGISLNFLLDVTNPNTFDLPLQGYSYEVRLMTLPLARGESKDSLSFYGKTSTDMLIPVRVSYADILEIIKHNPGLKEIPLSITCQPQSWNPARRHSRPGHERRYRHCSKTISARQPSSKIRRPFE